MVITSSRSTLNDSVKNRSDIGQINNKGDIEKNVFGQNDKKLDDKTENDVINEEVSMVGRFENELDKSKSACKVSCQSHLVLNNVTNVSNAGGQGGKTTETKHSKKVQE